jgi:hypothetical protein
MKSVVGTAGQCGAKNLKRDTNYYCNIYSSLGRRDQLHLSLSLSLSLCSARVSNTNP